MLLQEEVLSLTAEVHEIKQKSPQQGDVVFIEDCFVLLCRKLTELFWGLNNVPLHHFLIFSVISARWWDGVRTKLSA